MTDWTHKFEIQRFALACFALALALGFVPGALAQTRVPHLVVRQTATQSLTLVKPTDPNFENTIDAYFPGLAEEDGYQKAIKPFLVILENDADLPAVAYSITWRPAYSSGWASPLRAVFVSRPLMYRQAGTILRPGDIRLISPLFNVTPERYADTPSFTQVYSAARFPALDSQTTPVAHVDGVVYVDGTFIGPDTTKVLQRYVMARFAERDEALAALNFIRSSAQPPLVGAELLQSLDEEGQRDWRANQGTLLAWYVRARGESAQELRRILQNRGVSGLSAMLQAFVARLGIGDKPSMFDRAYRKLTNNDPRVFGPVPRTPGQP